MSTSSSQSYKRSLEIDTEKILQELRELRERIDDGVLEPPIHTDVMPTVFIKKDPANTLGKLKPTSLPLYNGDKPSYPAWRRAVLSALGMDWNTFGYTNSRAFLMIYKALEGRAQRQAAAYFESGGLGGKEEPEEFIKFLDRSNWDTTRIVRARGELNRMKMGKNQEWSSFFSMWANKLTESHGDNWPDETKITMLRGALSHKLRAALASNHLIPSDNYHEWIRIVGQIAMQHEELSRDLTISQNPSIEYRAPRKENPENYSNYRPRNQATEWGRSGYERGIVGDIDKSGDTFMGGVNMANVMRNSEGKPLRAKWKSPEQIAKLRSEKRCFRCEQQGCNTAVCRLLPAQKPKSKGPTISHVNLAQIDPELYEVVDETGPEEAENSEN